MDEKNIFREKSLERVSSPEQLNQYIKTTSPSLWILLIAIIIFLGGIIFWASTGNIESYQNVGCNVENGTMKCLIPETGKSSVKNDSYVEIENKKYNIDTVSTDPSEATIITDSNLLHASNIDLGQWYHVITVNKTDLKDGFYNAKVVYEIIKPIKFIIN